MINDAVIEGFINDLDLDEVRKLVELVSELNALEMVEGTPRYDSEQIDLIRKFASFVEENDEETDDYEDDIEEEDDEDGDIPGTGEDKTFPSATLAGPSE